MFSSTLSLMYFNFLDEEGPANSHGEVCRLADVEGNGDLIRFGLLLPVGDSNVSFDTCRLGFSVLEGMGDCISFHFSTNSVLDLIIANFSEIADLFHSWYFNRRIIRPFSHLNCIIQKHKVTLYNGTIFPKF